MRGEGAVLVSLVDLPDVGSDVVAHLRALEAAGSNDTVEEAEKSLYDERFLLARPVLRGNATAGAHVTVTMTGSETSTDVSVATDLAITGKPAQFGRGVMQGVSDKLLGQFVACLEERLTGADVPRVEEPATTSQRSGLGRHAAPVADPTPPPTRTPSADPEALDLGAAALPVLARLYWKHVRGAVVGLAVLRRLLRR